MNWDEESNKPEHLVNKSENELANESTLKST
jgi:hypothetical protein